MGKLDGAGTGASAGRREGHAGAIARAGARFVREAAILVERREASELACRLLVEEGANRAWTGPAEPPHDRHDTAGPFLASASIPNTEPAAALWLEVPAALHHTEHQALADLAAVVGLAGALLGESAKRTRGMAETEEALRRSERRLAAAIEGSDDGLWDWDGTSDENWTSNRWSTMLGYEPDELPRTIAAWHDLIHPDDYDAVIAANDALMTGDVQHYAAELRLRRKDGTYAWILDRGKVVEWGEDGRPLRVAGTHTDLTARHAMEQALRDALEEASASEARLREVLENATDAVWIVDGGLLEWANPATATLFGRPIDELVEMRMVDLIDRRDLDEARSVLRAMAAGEDVGFERRILRPDGTSRWMEVRGQALGGGRSQAIARDITDRKELEAERDRLADAVAQSFDAVVLADEAARILYANEAFARQVGLPLGEVIGRPIWFANAPGSDALRDEIAAALAAFGTWAGDVPVRRADGSTLTVSLRGSRVADAAGRSGGFLVTARDVTYERALEERLVESARMESIGQLAGGVAHDFNNILTAILGYADLAIGDLPSRDAATDDVAQIKAAAHRAQALTRQLLAFSRRSHLQPRSLLLGEVAASLQPMLERLIGEDVVLVLERGPELGPVHADPSMLDHAITNLVLNARDAMPQGGTIRIVTEGVTPDPQPGGAWGALRVIDDGVGITPELVGRIFEPFFTTKEVGAGTGLGLSMVQGFVAQSGGRLTLDSQVGLGSEFAILLPVGEVHLEAPLPVPAVRPAARGTVLVVEDEPMIREITRRILDRAGYEVVLAEAGPEALELLADPRRAVDLLFTDVVMPGMSGVDLAHRARELRPTIRLLLASGYTADEMSRRGISVDRVPFLPKPYEVGELLDAVAGAIGP